MSGFFGGSTSNAFFPNRRDTAPRRIFGAKAPSAVSEDFGDKQEKDKLIEINNIIEEAQESIQRYEHDSMQPDYQPITLETFFEDVFDETVNLEVTKEDKFSLPELVNYKEKFEEETTYNWIRSDKDSFDIVDKLEINYDAVGYKMMLLQQLKETRKLQKAQEKALDDEINDALTIVSVHDDDPLKQMIAGIFANKQWPMKGSASFGDFNFKSYVARFRSLKEKKKKFNTASHLLPLDFLKNYLQSMQQFLLDIFYRRDFEKYVYDVLTKLVLTIQNWSNEMDKATFSNFYLKDKNAAYFKNSKQQKRICVETPNKYFLVCADNKKGKELSSTFPGVFIHFYDIVGNKRKDLAEIFCNWIRDNYDDNRVIIVTNRKSIRDEYINYDLFLKNELDNNLFPKTKFHYRMGYVLDWFRMVGSRHKDFTKDNNLIDLLFKLNRNFKIYFRNID